MEQKPLIETNSYLHNPEKFRKALSTSVASSTAIETGTPVAFIARMLEEGKETRLCSIISANRRSIGA